MGKEREEDDSTGISGGFTDLFGISGSDFLSGNTEVKEVVEEIVSEGAEGVEEIKADDFKESEEVVKEDTEVVEEVKKDDVSEEASEVESLVTMLAESLLVDEEKEYDNSIDGIKQMIIDTRENAKLSALNEFKENLDEKGKLIFDALNSNADASSLESILNQVDYSEIPLYDDENNPIVQNQVNLIGEWLEKQGMEHSEINERLADLDKAGLIEKEAKLAQRKLIEIQDTENSKKIAEAKQIETQNKLALEQEQTRFKETVINTTEIAGFKIKKEDAARLYDYISKPTKSGKTAFMENDNEETRLLYAYLSMNKFNKDALAKEIETKKSISLKRTISNFKDTNIRQKSIEQERQKDVSISKINWSFGATS